MMLLDSVRKLSQIIIDEKVHLMFAHWCKLKWNATTIPKLLNAALMPLLSLETVQQILLGPFKLPFKAISITTHTEKKTCFGLNVFGSMP